MLDRFKDVTKFENPVSVAAAYSDGSEIAYNNVVVYQEEGKWLFFECKNGAVGKINTDLCQYVLIDPTNGQAE